LREEFIKARHQYFLGRTRGGFSRYNMNIASGRKLFLVGTKKLAANTLDAITGCRVSNFFGDGDAETGMGSVAQSIDHDEEPSDKPPSLLAQLYEFGALANAARFWKFLSQRLRFAHGLASSFRRFAIVAG
jgi:hypothetical protein